MPITPFLPGLMLALAAWILPFVVRFVPGKPADRLFSRRPSLSAWAPWIRSVGLPYLGLMLGWISSRDYGLTGQTPAEWILGSAAAVVLGIAFGTVSARLSVALGWGVIGDEARWTLYRAAAWPVLGFLPLAVAAALAAACAEFFWERRLRGGKVLDEVGRLFLFHAGGSAVLFLLAHNFFLAMLFYLSAMIVSTPEIRSRAFDMIHGIPKKQ